MGAPYTERFSEGAALLTSISPVSAVAANTPVWVDTSLYPRLVAKLKVGLIAAGGTLDMKLQQATSAAGANAKDIAGKAIVQLADTADNVDRWIELRTEELDVDGGFRYVGCLVTPAVAAALISMEILGFSTVRYEPVTQPVSLVVIP